jgi:hypothetical protein
MVNQTEKNLRLSFSYVKKDLLKINEQIESMNEKIQHIALNHASLLGELANLEGKIAGKSKTSKKNTKSKKSTHRGVSPAGQKKPVKKVVKETVTYS